MSVKARILKALPGPAAQLLRKARRAFVRELVDKPSLVGIGRFGGFEVAYRKGTADEATIQRGFENDIFFPGCAPEYVPAEGDVIIEVGAHIGTFSLLSSSRVGSSGRVHAIEASLESFNLLRINVALNRCDNVSTYHLAVSDQNGLANLHHCPGNWGHSIVSRLSGSSESTRSCTLDSFLRGNGIVACDFLKLNCEGAEFPILLSSAAATLQTIRVLLVLYHCDLWKEHTEVDLIRHLEASGFSCDIRNRAGAHGWVVAKRRK
jgi:FkbM family methyltransferase